MIARFLCPCRCGNLLTLREYIAKTGRDPRPVQGPRLPRRTLLPGISDETPDFVDPSDDPVYSREQRGVR